MPARYPSRTVGTAFALAVIFAVLNSVFNNPRWGWPVTALGATFGFLLGTLLALARVSGSPLLAALSWSYVWLFRSIPLIVLLLILNNLGYLYETISLGVPFTDVSFFSYQTTHLLTPFAAAVVGLTLNQAAFCSEVVRGGILSVDGGQIEAASALGLSRRRQVTRIVLPQAMRAIVPPGFNDIIGLAKGTSMVYILALPELFYTIQIICRRNLEVIPLLMVAIVWYLVIPSVLSMIQVQIERHYARGALRNPPPSLLTKLLGRRPVAVAPAPAPSQVAQAASGASLAGFAASGGEVRIEGISKSFGARKVLDGIDLAVAPGSVVAIIGPSGSGKSTLLRAINHLEQVDDGTIAIDGELIGYRREDDALFELKERDIPARRVGVGMVFQTFNLFPHLTAVENVMEAPISVRGLPRVLAEAQGREWLARVGLSDKAGAYPRQFSGGQQQRVAIARALAMRPKVLLFDEPTSALDPELVGEVLDVIKELARSGTTLVIVMHEIGFAREVADHVVFMEAGRIVEQGTPAEVLGAPRHPRTREFLSKVL